MNSGEMIILILVFMFVMFLGVVILYKLGFLRGGGSEKKSLGHFDSMERADDVIFDPENDNAIYPFAHIRTRLVNGENYAYLYYSTGGGLEGHDETLLKTVLERRVIKIDCHNSNSLAKTIYYVIPHDPMMDPIHGESIMRLASAEERIKHLTEANQRLNEKVSALDVQEKAARQRQSMGGLLQQPVRPNIILSRQEVESGVAHQDRQPAPIVDKQTGGGQ